MDRFIENPVLPGFHPDPSILRVGDDYHVANSTFEWFPGVRLHHSRNIVSFRPIGHALTRPDQLDLIGTTRSGGIWAPDLSHDGERFWLLFTHVRTWGGAFHDAANYLVWADRIEGPWSAPVFLHARGFDPSLFHEHGRTYLLWAEWDHRAGAHAVSCFRGIGLQELSRSALTPTGRPRLIFHGSPRGMTEGPHVYRRGDWYYLLVAEGGTSYEHAATVARSRSLEGPYELDPSWPLLTSSDRSDAPLQKAGHGSLVETPAGQWFLAHLVGRPRRARRCPLGRETALEEVVWTADGWPRLAHGSRAPRPRVPAPALAPWHVPRPPSRDDFSRAELGPEYQTLRAPADESWLSLRARPGSLRLTGRESPESVHRQSLVGRRARSFRYRFETEVDFDPGDYQALAGLLLFYDDQNFAYLHVTHHEAHGRVVDLLVARRGRAERALATPRPVADGPVRLRGSVADDVLRWSICPAGAAEFEPIGPELDATELSDEHVTAELGFTGTFVALGCHDVSGARRHADFLYLELVDEPE